ncbi:fungal-specific transcription factor domain-containing protein [Phialemonium atrogriseum]|uniref:Fungal-specific transcription factor domain-containing protein n=1 Tax=Phialemonium atrogriseum TaxID=1093897 RepID=A0AAJ0FM90_9PEZI|nr:fungal-specific transcription factor domain-containing protein [Phialemonium atrogriseum]KAK1767564.1 fungal-specific transcription factor domain-containing protein [Phialemonium atrogriseum]
MSSKTRLVPAELRQRTEHSCDRCKSRKQKCNTSAGQLRCTHCLKYGYDCVVTKPRKQRLRGSVEAYSARMAALEGLVKGLVPEADLSSLQSVQSVGRALGIPLPDGAAGPGDGRPPTESEGGGEKGSEHEQLVHDRQGQSQYIGRASSYFFQMKLRAMVSPGQNGSIRQMHLFGPNPADRSLVSERSLDITRRDMETVDIHSIANSTSLDRHGSAASPKAAPRHTDRTTVLLIVRAFFDRVNVDFPVLHEASFLETLEAWCKSPTAADHVWLCSFLCVLMLGRRHCDIDISDEQEERWWLQIQMFLPKVMFTSSLASIQSLMLAALHLHNTNSRDICWTLTGAAVRIGFAIGLHRDDIETDGTPLLREMRKKLWWTLYSFEQLQVSSYDRPSAMNDARHLPGPPREGILGMAANNLPEYATWCNRLATLLGAANSLPEAAKSDFSGPLSPAVKLLSDLTSWNRSLPQHLSMDAIDSMPPQFQRILILLHVQYHYTASFVSRYALLSRFTALSGDSTRVFSGSLASISDTCIESGRQSSQLLLKLDSINNFNAVSWLDVYYIYSSTLILVLSIICDVTQDKTESATDTRQLLGDCFELSSKYLSDDKVPGTMRRWLTIVGELQAMVDEFTNAHDGRNSGPPSGRASQPPIRGANKSSSGVGMHDSTLNIDSGQYRTDLSGTVLEPILASLFDPETTADFQFPNLPSFPGFSYDYSLPHAGPTESRAWQEMHWEEISDMLLGATESLT